MFKTIRLKSDLNPNPVKLNGTEYGSCLIRSLDRPTLVHSLVDVIDIRALRVLLELSGSRKALYEALP